MIIVKRRVQCSELKLKKKNIYVMGDKETELLYNLNLDIL